MQAIKVLVVASKDLQKEIVESGRVGRAMVWAPTVLHRGQICHPWGYFPDTVGS